MLDRTQSSFLCHEAQAELDNSCAVWAMDVGWLEKSGMIERAQPQITARRTPTANPSSPRAF
ncbi:MAG TPA: hypothetical protein VNO32_65885, partial [Candidatus Acidoferrum sp.]|nr:hypothetical protein [Candidatus Acidoferrum sp.]